MDAAVELSARSAHALKLLVTLRVPRRVFRLRREYFQQDEEHLFSSCLKYSGDECASAQKGLSPLQEIKKSCAQDLANKVIITSVPRGTEENSVAKKPDKANEKKTELIR